MFPFISRAPIVINLFIVLLIVIVLLLNVSIYLVKQKQYSTHKSLQILITVLLLIGVVFFELEMRTRGWVYAAKLSPFYNTFVWPALLIHILIAIITLFFWFFAIFHALKNFPNPLLLNSVNQSIILKHKLNAKYAIISLYATVISGLIFYYLAFIA